MAARVATLQDRNGYWHASLLDPESYPNPETSSSGFFTYALAWGINTGLLDKSQYFPVVKKGWQALVHAVYADGKLGWVQPISADPKKVTRDMTEVYGVGAFLLAGTEIYKLAVNENNERSKRIRDDGDLEVWCKELSGNRHAVALFNRSKHPANITVDWSEVGMEGKVSVRDVWKHKDLGQFKNAFIGKNIPGHSAMVLLLSY